MNSKFEDITLFGLHAELESSQKIIAKTDISLSPRTECVIPDLVADNRKFRFGVMDYPDTDRARAGVLKPVQEPPIRREVTYLGHIISAEGVRTDPDKISAVRHWTCPTDVHQLRSFLGLCTYYRKFVKNFSIIARPFHKLTEAKQKFIWTDVCDNAFNKLKDAITSAPVLAYPEIGKQVILDTDASHECIGAVLSQEIDGQERVIAYFSKCLSKQERSCVTRKELLAIVKTVENFRPYLYGRRFLLCTDHASLTWLLNFKNPEGQIARWIQRLQEYGMEIRHRKGSAHGNADALSRRPCSENCKIHALEWQQQHPGCRTTSPNGLKLIPFPIKKPDVAEILVQNWISRYGVPLQLHSDQGRNFDSAVCTRLCEILGIDKIRTTALHPQSDGIVERFNRTILNSLSLLVSRNQQDWDKKLPFFLLAYRSAVHETTGYFPSQMLFGRDLRLPADLLFSRPPDAPLAPEEYFENLRTRWMEEVHHLARDRIGMASEKMKTRYDARATGHNFHEGDQVGLWIPKRRKELSPKLQTNWEGPYTILKRLNDVVVRIQKSPHSKPKVIHCNRLDPYLGQGD
ncbi:Retrovirus-related Pol polyprotein like [Argiope bruennichi]|uniref:RNA-directed DNA polymerase n=1 Tax=Argiope bruennichi TaxID=94029 RepID=A0A8T0EZL2_ARGBR|nr:Retrovirus-related Pol polyprotein like [Argiope bruennichi]